MTVITRHPRNKHYAPWHRQFRVDTQPYLVGIVVLTLCAAVVTLTGMLLASSGRPITGSMVLLAGLVTVALAGAYWVGGKIPGTSP